MNISHSKSRGRRNSEIGSLKTQAGRIAFPALGSPLRFDFWIAAFSLIEILVVVALLSIIVLGLLAMFSQTQKAFRAGLTQTDVLASGRLASEMLNRELQQITPAYQVGTNFDAPNFYAQMPYDAATYKVPFTQPLPGMPGNLTNTTMRTNFLHDVFFVSKQNQDWVGIGYFVRVNNPGNGDLSLSPLGIGNLYRFETNATVLSGRTISNLFNEFQLARRNENLVINGKIVNRSTKLAEGVLNFKVRTFNPQGALIKTNQDWRVVASDSKYTVSQLNGETEVYLFQSNAVPAAVELELGFLEDKVWQRFRALPSFGTPPAGSNYLANQVGRVHLFRQRVAVRNLDPSAYSPNP